MKISEIIQDGWLFEDDRRGLAIISKKTTGEYVMVGKEITLEFPTITKLNEYLKENGGIDSIEVKEKKDIAHYIRGYPVSYPNPILVESDSDLPLFCKREESDVNLCAGYYILKTNKGWRTVFCPKENTLIKYEWKGPFREPPVTK